MFQFRISRGSLSNIQQQLGLTERQLNEITVQAINKTLAIMKEENIAYMPTVIDRPTPFTLRGLKILEARKYGKFKQKGKLVFLPIQKKYMQYPILGGVLESITTPMETSILDKYGNIRNLKRGLKTLASKKNRFLGEVKGMYGVWERQKHGKLKPIVLVLHNRERHQIYNFFEFSKSIFDKNFKRAFQEAQASAIR